MRLISRILPVLSIPLFMARPLRFVSTNFAPDESDTPFPIAEVNFIGGESYPAW